MRVEIQGQHFELFPERAALWTEKSVLICSDLHWGRENFLQKFGMAIPSHSFEMESEILYHLLKSTGARELWILGDFIHHPKGLDADLLDRLHAWLLSLQVELKVEVAFVPGNHDRKFKEWAANLPLKIHPEGIRSGDFCFLHEPPLERTNNDYHWYGHLHPSLRIGALFGNRKIPCFLIRRREAFLPAFSRLAGGATVNFIPSDRIFGIAEKQVFEWRSKS
ncbi:MAG: ligase-associated DNA damage response endonuclease PdeM [Bdellovibrionales bacterium]|nr:ligase-associated DNA damage response endonuclease PdeM [Oligoflexia bacterium]